MTFAIFCNGNKIAQRATQQQADAFAAERKARFPKQAYEVRPDEQLQEPRYVYKGYDEE